jgi:hypothetical protein
VQKIVSVSHDELKRREAEWKKQHRGRKAGRKRSSRKGARERTHENEKAGSIRLRP